MSKNICEPCDKGHEFINFLFTFGGFERFALKINKGRYVCTAIRDATCFSLARFVALHNIE